MKQQMDKIWTAFALCFRKHGVTDIVYSEILGCHIAITMINGGIVRTECIRNIHELIDFIFSEVFLVLEEARVEDSERLGYEMICLCAAKLDAETQAVFWNEVKSYYSADKG